MVNDAPTRAFEDDTEITQQLLENVISENSPSVSEKDLAAYANIKKEIEEVNTPKQRRPIGFR